MTGRQVAERLTAAGLDHGEERAKTGLYDGVLSTFRGHVASSPDSVAWVPGRLEVFGTHTDYAGGRTLVAAVPRGFAVAAKHRIDGRVTVIDAASGASVSIAARARPHLTGWRRYVGVVVERLRRNFPGSDFGADIVFASDLPAAAGISSSSALMVAIARTLAGVSGIRSSAEWQTSIRNPLDEAGYYACIENGRTFGTLAGDAGVGTHGGSEDHAAMLCGRPGAVSGYAFVPMRHIETVAIPSGWTFVVASSGVAAEKTGGALESYNRLARGTVILHDLWNRYETAAPSLAAALAAGGSALSRLNEIVRASRVAGWPPAALEARLLHFNSEDARIPDALRAFNDRDAGALKEIAAASQTDAERLLGNQVDETVNLTRLALENGAFASRSFGAGFGGSVWALVEDADATDFLEGWLQAYRRRFPQRDRALGFVSQPGPPAMELAPTRTSPTVECEPLP